MKIIKQISTVLAICASLSAQAGTIFDVQKVLDAALIYQTDIPKYAVKHIIEEKIKAGQTDDVKAIKEMLNNYKEKLAQRSSQCISTNTIDTMYAVSRGFEKASYVLRPVGEILVFCGFIINIMSVSGAMGSCMVDGKSVNTYYMELAQKAGLRSVIRGGLMVLTSAGVSLITDELRSIIQRRSFVKNAQKDIDELLHYISYQEGLAVRPIEE